MARRKPSVRVVRTKNGLQIIKTMYDEFGKVIKKSTEGIR